jgi:hypothetical protein
MSSLTPTSTITTLSKLLAKRKALIYTKKSIILAKKRKLKRRLFLKEATFKETSKGDNRYPFKRSKITR